MITDQWFPAPELPHTASTQLAVQIVTFCHLNLDLDFKS